METREKKQIILENMIQLLELPVSAYEKAQKRYEDLGAWFGRDDSTLNHNDPHIFPQGSFRLGTANRPLDDNDEYDLDMVCRLRAGITRDSHSQEALKRMVGIELESYRRARNIISPLKGKHRCWCLDYQDDLSFHMDIIPCIPADRSRQAYLMEAMKKAGEEEFLAGTVSQFTISITDDRHPRFKQISDDWLISNPEGYARWFEARMNKQNLLILEKAQVDDVPLFRRKTPLQRAIQLLKRHRDLMFRKDPDCKPISIIITTLAARAYKGEFDIESSLGRILSDMATYVNTSMPRVPNPVNPEEDFADRWSMPKYRHLNLESNFWSWLAQAQSDFDLLGEIEEAGSITEQVQKKFSLALNASDLSGRLGWVTPSVTATMPKHYSISAPAKPWRVA